MSFKSKMGIDGIDFAIQGVLTAILMGWATTVNPGPDGDIFVFMIGTASLVTLAVRRHLGLKKLPGRGTTAGLTTGEMEAERLADLESRLGELDMLHVQVAELTDRLDFAERLLSQQRDPAALPRGDG